MYSTNEFITYQIVQQFAFNKSICKAFVHKYFNCLVVILGKILLHLPNFVDRQMMLVI